MSSLNPSSKGPRNPMIQKLWKTPNETWPSKHSMTDTHMNSSKLWEHA